VFEEGEVNLYFFSFAQLKGRSSFFAGGIQGDELI
jgi:hypothetical protein